MKRLLRLPSLLTALTMLVAPAANAAGMIVVDPLGGLPAPRPAIGGLPGPRPVPILPGPRPIPGPRPTPGPRPVPRPTPGPVLKGSVSFGLRLQKAEVRVDINDQVAKTYICQTFANDTDRQLAGTYLFPLPEDTTFSSFSLHIDGKPVEGKILEANEARQQYEEIVRRMVDPGLLEYADYKTVRARIFPIPAHGTKKVELEYTQLLKAEGGLLKYRFPLKTESESAPAEEVKVNVKLNSKQGLRTIWSPSHIISAERNGDHSAKIAYHGQDTVPDKDFLLYYSVSDKDMAANVLTHRTGAEDGYYLLTLSPPVEAKSVTSKDIVLVADTSGSMQGERMEQNKRALKYFVNALGSGDRFNIVEFNTDVESFKSALVAATPENKKAALSFIDDLEARGGTNIGDALKMGATILDQPSDRPAYLVLMTDGEPTVGATTIPELLKTVHAKRDIRLFDFGVGYDVNTRLLNKLAEEHHGTAQYIEPDESIETALASFYQKIKTPVLSNVKIAYNGIQVKDVYPREVKDIFAGTQVLMLGRYKGPANGNVQITGTVNGVAKAYTFPISMAASETGNSYLPRLWAMRRIGHLTDVAQKNNDNREIVDEIIALSKKYGIISAYTSFLVTDPSEGNANRPQPVAMNAADFSGVSRRGLASAVAPAASPAPSATAGGGGGWMPRAERARSGARFQFAPDSFMSKQELAAAAPMPQVGSAGMPAGRVRELKEAGTKSRDKAHFYKAPWEMQLLDQAKDVRQLALGADSGKAAVKKAKVANKLKNVVAVADEESSAIKSAGDKTFYLSGDTWVESTLNADAKAQIVTFGSKEYFELLKLPGVSKYLAVGRQVIFAHAGKVYKVVLAQDG